MILALSSKAMRLADELAVTRARIPSIELMESAGKGLLNVLEEAIGSLNRKRIVIVCGNGNNGGDGYVLARLLVEYNCLVRCLTVGNSVKTPDTATNFRRLEKLASRYPELLSIGPMSFAGLGMPDGGSPDAIVDAIMGTGLSSALRGPAVDAVKAINECRSFVLAVDVPTGVDSDTGLVWGDAVRADATVTMASLKTGLLLGEGPSSAGDVRVADIGIPSELLLEAGERHGMIRMLERPDFLRMLPRRKPSDHKYSVGMVGIVGGSPGLTGAVAMSARAAYRSGAGAVVCAVPKSVEAQVANKLVEAMTVSLPEDEAGISPDAFSIVDKRMEKAQCLLIGPGLGRKKETAAFVNRLMKDFSRTCVIDADALNAISSIRDVKSSQNAPRIMTPHWGEFERMTDSSGSILDRAKEFARESGAILVLKGSPTVVAAPEGDLYLGRNSSHALATAGTGDVLGGMIASFCAQGLTPIDACLVALYAGELAAHRFCSDRSFLSMVATDIIDQLPYVLFDDSHS